jgi:hypothetical protein
VGTGYLIDKITRTGMDMSKIPYSPADIGNLMSIIVLIDMSIE